jgi:hypothetical protein
MKTEHWFDAMCRRRIEEFSCFDADSVSHAPTSGFLKSRD